MPRNSQILSHTYITRRRLAVEDFMVCPLCSAVNVLANEECFCCGWSGEFSYDPIQIETRLYDMIYRCPELLAVLIEEDQIPVPDDFWTKVRRFFGRFRHKIDVRA